MTTAVARRVRPSRAGNSPELLASDGGAPHEPVDYSDEVTLQQMAKIEEEFAHLDLQSWTVKEGPAW